MLEAAGCGRIAQSGARDLSAAVGTLIAGISLRRAVLGSLSWWATHQVAPRQETRNSWPQPLPSANRPASAVSTAGRALVRRYAAPSGSRFCRNQSRSQAYAGWGLALCSQPGCDASVPDPITTACPRARIAALLAPVTRWAVEVIALAQSRSSMRPRMRTPVQCALARHSKSGPVQSLRRYAVGFQKSDPGWYAPLLLRNPHRVGAGRVVARCWTRHQRDPRLQ